MKSYSKECQDLFVLSVLNQKMNGTYLELGGDHPINYNNTYTLESQYGWSGISYEISLKHKANWNKKRKNVCNFENALKVDYSALFEDNTLDYLALDIHPPKDTLDLLKIILDTGLQFRVITFEHARQQFGDETAFDQITYLENKGYTLVMKDCMWGTELLLEDWWVYEPLLDNDNWKKMVGSEISFDKKCITEDTKKLFSQFIDNIEFHCVT